MKESQSHGFRSFERYKSVSKRNNSKRTGSYAQVGIMKGDEIVSSKNVYPHFESIRRVTFGLMIPKPFYSERIEFAGDHADHKAHSLNKRAK